MEVKRLSKLNSEIVKDETKNISDNVYLNQERENEKKIFMNLVEKSYFIR